jgi:Fe-S-cluster containining protein
MKEGINKTQEFIVHAFPLSNNCGMKCPCIRCRNIVYEDKRMLTLHLCKFGFMPGYEV